MKHLRICRRLAYCVVAATISSALLHAQSTFGTITGVITDPTTAVVPGASVEIKNLSTNIVRTATSDAQGVYSAVNLDPGNYTITIRAKGFAEKTSQTLELPARETIRVDVPLSLSGGTATTVEVRETIVSEDLTLSDSKSGTEIGSLALNFRASANPSPLVVANLSPGVVPDSAGHISVAGQLPTATAFSLDGISTQNVRVGGPNTDQFPSVESIAEFRVNTAGDSAEYSQPSDITAISRSGTNQFHGAGFGYMQRRDWNSADALSGNINNGDANAFGATIGGPIFKNKTFFLFTYEGDRLDQNTSIQTTTAPAEWRGGDFSKATSLIFDPQARAPFPNNTIPTARLNAVALKMLNQLVPSPTSDVPSLNANNFNVLFPGNYSVDGFDGRLDQNFGAKHKVFFRASNKQVTSAGANNSTSYDTVLGTYSQNSDLQNYVGSYNWIVKPSMVNEFRIGYTGSNYTFGYPFASQGDSIITGLGITGLPGPPVNKLGGVPALYFPTLFGGNTSPGHPRDQKNGVFEANDNFTWIKGRHTIKGGFEYRHMSYQDNITFLSGDEYGDYFFTGAFTGGSGDANALAGMLLGFVDQDYFAQNGPDGKPYNSHYGGFIQDQWRATPRLTVTAGLRYEVNVPFNDSTHQLGNFNTKYPGGELVIQPGETVSPAWRAQVEGLFGNVPFVLNKAVGLPETLRYTYYENIQPRLGFAYKVNDKTTIRASSGIYSVPVLGAVLYSLLGVDTSNFAGFTSSATSPLIFPNVFPNGSAANPGIPSYRRANSFDLKDPRVIQWNFSIDREILRDTVVRIAYTGSHSYNLIYSPDLNQVHPNTSGYAALTATPALRLQNLKFPSFGEVLTRANGPGAKYDALTLEGNRRFGRNLTFTNSYTWAHNTTNALGVAPNSNNGQGGQGDNGANVNNFFDIKSDYGNAPFTPRHRFVNTFVYALPIGRGELLAGNISRAANLLIGGWRLTGFTIAQTGPYLTPYFTNGDPSGTNPSQRSVSQQRPDVVPGVSAIPSDQSASGWFNAAAFSIPANNIGRFGNAGTGILKGPATVSFSMSVGKNFQVTERVGFRYEAQFSNLFNVENLATPNMNLRSANFGKIFSEQSVLAGGPRTIQMSFRLYF
jgi:hypothetical protein